MNRDDRDALTDPDGRSRGYQSKVPSVARRIDAVLKDSNRYLSKTVSSILEDLRYQGTFHSKAEAYAWLKKTPTMDAVNALIKQAEALPGPQRRKAIRQIMSGAKASRMSRLDALNESLKLNKAIIKEGVKRNVTPVMRSLSKDAYLRQTFTLQKQVGVGWAVDEPPAGQIVAGMNSTLDAMAEWYHGPLDQKIRDAIVEGIASGKTHAQIAKDLAHYEVPPARAKAVARTMITTVSNEAEMKALKETRIKRYEYVATLDERTCPVCGRLDGKTFPLDKAKAGVNFPPMHPNCRCVHIAALSKEVKNELTRSARDEHGRTRTVSASMTYDEWSRMFGSERVRKALAETETKLKASSKTVYDRTVPTRERRTVTMDDFGVDFVSTPKRKRNTERIVSYLNDKTDADPNAVAVIQNAMSNKDAPEIEIRYTDESRITPNPAKPMLAIPDHSNPDRRRMCTVFHEMTHLSDFFHRKSKDQSSLSTAHDSALSKAIADTPSDIPEHTAKLFRAFDAEFNKLYDDADIKNKQWTAKLERMVDDYKKGLISKEDFNIEYDKYKEWVRNINVDIDDTGRSRIQGGGIDMLEDIYDALSGGSFQSEKKVKFGHGKQYYARNGMREAELIANYTALSIERPDLIAQLRKDKPALCRELDRVMYELGE